MLIELIVAAFVAAYVAVAVLGHVLLIAAIYRCLREDSAGGRGRRAADRAQTAAGDTKPLTATKPAARSGATRPASAGAVVHLVRPDVEHPQHS